jgi:hypothetical protein
MHNEPLTEDNFLLYSARYYNNPHCADTDEFYEDLSRFKYLKRLFNRFQESGEIKERLALNHIIIIYNVFGIPAATRMLFLKLPEEHRCILKPFLVKLNYMPERVEKIGPKAITIRDSDISMNPHIVEVLRTI